MEVSVIIPVYNAEKFIERAVMSALAQPETCEVILIDDASTDNSFNICQQLSCKNSKVILLWHDDKRNHGPGATRNIGIKHARYPYIAFLDADDYFVRNRFSASKKIFENDETVDGVYGYVERFCTDLASRQFFFEKYGNKQPFKTDFDIPFFKLFSHMVLSNMAVISIVGLVVKSKVFEEIDGFDTTLTQCEDTDFIWRLCLKKKLMSDGQKHPVCYSSIHYSNLILKDHEVESMKWQLYKKWFFLVAKNDWGYIVNRTLLNNYMYYNPILGKSRNNFFLRIPFKMVMLIVIMFKNPSMMLKFM